MKLFKMLAFALPIAIATSAVPAQDYWEYDEWGDRWVRHVPDEGLRVEYENGVDVEEQEYEWEAGEGYHEEEWYDPSDWFSRDDDAVDYEYEYGYYDDYGYYNYYDDDYYGYTASDDVYWDEDYAYDYYTDDDEVFEPWYE